jgi:branched-chain amino acid transport system permease protein
MATILFDGIAYGMLLFLLACGLSVTLGLMNFINLAHGSFAMAGGYCAVVMVNRMGVPFALGLVIAFLVTAAIGVLLERTLYVHVYAQSHLDQVLFTMGLVFMSVAMTDYVMGSSQQFVRIPDALQGRLNVFGIGMGKYRLLIIVICGALAAALQLIVTKTRFGIRLRAAVDDQRVARGLGINVGAVFGITFAFGSGLAGLSGALGAEILGLDPIFPLKYMIYFLIVVTVGGTSSVTGPFLASMLLGIGDVAGKYYVPKLGAFVIYAIMIVVLIWRPHGLFAGSTAIDRRLYDAVSAVLGRSRRDPAGRGRSHGETERGIVQFELSARQALGDVGRAGDRRSAGTAKTERGDKPILEMIGLEKRFDGVIAVDAVTLAVAKGARHALIGPNGAGKTTVINLLTGLSKPTAGRIILEGNDITDVAQHQRVRLGTARAFQINQLFLDLTPLEIVGLAASERLGSGGDWWRLVGSKSAVTDEIIEMVERFHLADVMHQRTAVLPYGKQRLLEIALAFACRPRVLLLDEPAAGVPEADRHELLATIAGLPSDVTVLLIEHDMDIVFSFADRISVLVNGSVFVDGAPEDVARDPRVKAVYLGEALDA